MALKRPLPVKSSKPNRTIIRKPPVKALKPKPSKATTKSGKSGKTPNAFKQAEEENERKKVQRELRMNKPWPFRLNVGETAKVILLDADEPFTCYEHSRWAQKKDAVPCIKEHASCPACEALGSEGVWQMVLTCLVPESVDKDGKKYYYQKRLFVIKSAMAAKFRRLWEKKNTFRGMVITCSRDTDKSPASGNDIEFVKYLSEQELRAIDAKYRKDKEKVKTPLYTVVDYEKAYPDISADDLRKLLGQSGKGGSRSVGGEDLGDEDETVDEDFEVDLD